MATPTLKLDLDLRDNSEIIMDELTDLLVNSVSAANELTKTAHATAQLLTSEVKHLNDMRSLSHQYDLKKAEIVNAKKLAALELPAIQ